MKNMIFCILTGLTILLFSSFGYADDAEFRTVISQNDESIGGEFHLDLQIRITDGTSPRTLNSLTIDIYYESELTAWADNPATDWAFGSANGYTRSANKNSGYYRILAIGGGVNEDANESASGGSPPGWDVTTDWQTIATLRWTIATVTSINININDETDAAAYFNNYTNAPPGSATPWTVSNQDLTDQSSSIDDLISIIPDKLPAATSLEPAIPNPFNPSTKIAYKLAEDTQVTLSVIDMMGRTVQTIISGHHQTAGSYSIHWNGNNNYGQPVASGTYLLLLRAGTVRKTQKIMLMR